MVLVDQVYGLVLVFGVMLVYGIVEVSGVVYGVLNTVARQVVKLGIGLCNAHCPHTCGKSCGTGIAGFLDTGSNNKVVSKSLLVT